MTQSKCHAWYKLRKLEQGARWLWALIVTSIMFLIAYAWMPKNKTGNEHKNLKILYIVLEQGAIATTISIAFLYLLSDVLGLPAWVSGIIGVPIGIIVRFIHIKIRGV